MSRLLKGVVCVGLWLGLAIKSDVSGMVIDTSRPYVKANPTTMGVNATGSAVVYIDLKEIGVVGDWVLKFTNDEGRFASDADRTKVIKSAKSVRAIIKFSGREVKNSDGKTVAYAGIGFTDGKKNYSGIASGNGYRFNEGVVYKLLWVLYKDRKKSTAKFNAGDELPAEWTAGTDGTLTCAMTVNVVAAS